ncbi:MAG: ABC transporter ATP-binding protein [bacterium]
MNSKISVSGVSMTFHTKAKKALENIEFKVAEGEFLCILGPSGCGKTTLLRILAGFLTPTSGSIIRRAARPDRPFNCMVFQDLALFPWKTVIENVSIAPRLQGRTGTESEEIAATYLSRMNMSGFENYYPHQLSGGMKQRVALARAFASDAEVLLMDEPLGALDASTRRLLQNELLLLWESRNKTIVFVTHDIEEALLLADRILVLSSTPGRIKAKVDVPFPRPRTPDIRECPHFNTTAGHIWNMLEEEVKKSVK